MTKLTVKKYVNNNRQSKAYGKTYGRLVHNETLSTNDLCRHIQKHGTIFTSDIVKGVVEKFITCFEELLLEGYKLKLDGLGTFYLSLSTIGEQDASDFGAQNIKAVRVKFLADQSKESEYTTRMLTQKARFRSLSDDGEDTSGGQGSGDSGDVPGEDRP